jgi:hypothetical protein
MSQKDKLLSLINTGTMVSSFIGLIIFVTFYA